MGRRGCGKSTLAKKIQDAFPRQIIIDTLHEYEEGEIFYEFNEFADRIGELAKTNSDQYKLVLQLAHDDELAIDTFEQCIRLAHELGNCLIIIEEVQLFSSHHKLPSQLKNVLLVGRHQNIGLMFTSQRAGEVHKTILSQCGHIFVGQMHEKNDVSYLKSFFGESAEQLPNLPVHEFIYFQSTGLITRVKNKI